MSRNLGISELHVGEKFPIELPYRYPDIDLDNDVVISDVDVAVSPAGLTVNNESHDDSKAWAWVEGGTAGTSYTVTFTTSTSDGKKLINEVTVKVIA